MSCYHLPVKSPQEVPHIGKVRRRHEFISESSYSTIWICVLFLKQHFKVGFCKNKQIWGLGMCFCLITIRSQQMNELTGRYSSRLRNQIIFCLRPSKVFYFKDNWNCVYCFLLRLFPLCVTDVSPLSGRWSRLPGASLPHNGLQLHQDPKKVSICLWKSQDHRLTGKDKCTHSSLKVNPAVKQKQLHPCF